ncbi:hypothetical protein BIZ92_30170 [Achromobacter xylosoxidans]|uniref:Uncharacterized protein n=1 Tax=Alcaligenes xylosoxydans xylosoxydans TaxID=85698 RepID=A0A1R1JQ26_ALCXX|nr:hypothetical protein BIZ92_30170 [Achromobacter xylosoxidans]
MTSGEDCLALQEAYLAMFEFMAQLYQRTGSDEVGSVLGDLSMLADGTIADPAAWGDWMRCVENARQGAVDGNLVIIPKPDSR